MKAIMLSIQPKYCELIASGKKTVEVRKTRPKIETPFKCYIYETKKKINPWCNGKGKVIGEFVCDYIGTVGWTSNPNKKDWKDWFNEETCLTDRETYEYTKGDKFYEWHISDLKIYDKPKELSEFKHYKKFDWWDYGHHTNKPQWELRSLTRPFQSWGYVEEIEI